MQLDDRKKRILSAIIEDYISSAEPIGSRTISKNHSLDVSPATIRNEMADLEDMGLLISPHTSAGRVPTNVAYRFYVDELMERYSLTNSEIQSLSSLLQSKILQMDNLISEISATLAKMTNYTVVSLTPKENNGYIKQFHFFAVDDFSFVAVLVTDKNIVKNKIISSRLKIITDDLKILDIVLNKTMTNLKLNQITDEILKRLYMDCGSAAALLPEIIEFIYQILDSINNNDLHIGGVSSLLNYPEYKDVERAKEILQFLENGDNLKNLLARKQLNCSGVKILIGDENEAIELKDCSVILSSYSVGDKMYGSIGLIGPTRMDYSKAVSKLEFFTNKLNKLLEGEGDR